MISRNSLNKKKNKKRRKGR